MGNNSLADGLRECVVCGCLYHEDNTSDPEKERCAYCYRFC